MTVPAGDQVGPSAADITVRIGFYRPRDVAGTLVHLDDERTAASRPFVLGSQPKAQGSAMLGVESAQGRAGV